jgi:hypothetical protein
MYRASERVKVKHRPGRRKCEENTKEKLTKKRAISEKFFGFSSSSFANQKRSTIHVNVHRFVLATKCTQLCFWKKFSIPRGVSTTTSSNEKSRSSLLQQDSLYSNGTASTRKKCSFPQNRIIVPSRLLLEHFFTLLVGVSLSCVWVCMRAVFGCALVWMDFCTIFSYSPIWIFFLLQIIFMDRNLSLAPNALCYRIWVGLIFLQNDSSFEPWTFYHGKLFCNFYDQFFLISFRFITCRFRYSLWIIAHRVPLKSSTADRASRHSLFIRWKMIKWRKSVFHRSNCR